MAREKAPSNIDRLPYELKEDGVDAEKLFGEDSLLKCIKEAIQDAVLTDHLDYAKHVPMAGIVIARATARPSRTIRATCRYRSQRPQWLLRSEADSQVPDPMYQCRDLEKPATPNANFLQGYFI